MTRRWTANDETPVDGALEGLLPPGKLPPVLLMALLADQAAPGPEVLVGPAIGEDACVVDVSGGVLVAATDPITLSTRDLGRNAVIINANDVAVMGVRPRWFLAVVLLPSGGSSLPVREIFETMRAGLEEIGASLVGGHTEVTASVNHPLVVGQMMGTGQSYVTSGGARPGDEIVQVGQTPVEGAAVLASEAAQALEGLPTWVRKQAIRALEDPGISIVEPALLAARLGATAMHDPTEGGLAAALHEMAVAASVSITVDPGAVLWYPPGLAVCRSLGADPWGTLASGTLLATFSPELSDKALTEFHRRGYEAASIGAVGHGTGVRVASGGLLPWPEQDEVMRVLSSVGG